MSLFDHNPNIETLADIVRHCLNLEDPFLKASSITKILNHVRNNSCLACTETLNLELPFTCNCICIFTSKEAARDFQNANGGSLPITTVAGTEILRKFETATKDFSANGIFIFNSLHDGLFLPKELISEKSIEQLPTAGASLVDHLTPAALFAKKVFPNLAEANFPSFYNPELSAALDDISSSFSTESYAKFYKLLAASTGWLVSKPILIINPQISMSPVRARLIFSSIKSMTDYIEATSDSDLATSVMSGQQLLNRIASTAYVMPDSAMHFPNYELFFSDGSKQCVYFPSKKIINAFGTRKNENGAFEYYAVSPHN